MTPSVTSPAPAKLSSLINHFPTGSRDTNKCPNDVDGDIKRKSVWDLPRGTPPGGYQETVTLRAENLGRFNYLLCKSSTTCNSYNDLSFIFLES